MDSVKFARWVDAEIAKRGLKKQDFYKGSGISSATLSQWRTGLYAPSKSAIEKVEQFFGVSFDINYEPTVQTVDVLGAALSAIREEIKKDPAQSAESEMDIQFRQETSDLTDAELADVLEYIRFKKSQRGK